ncbi:MAG: ABC transporter permease, partial [Brasilonema sp.]
MKPLILAKKKKIDNPSTWEIISLLAWKNIKLRYQNSALGFFWSILNPLIFLLIFVFIFSQAFSDIKNYPIFALSGLIYWNFFATSSSQILGSVLEGAGILKSIAIPALIFPLSAIYAALINLAL